MKKFITAFTITLLLGGILLPGQVALATKSAPATTSGSSTQNDSTNGNKNAKDIGKSNVSEGTEASPIDTTSKGAISGGSKDIGNNAAGMDTAKVAETSQAKGKVESNEILISIPKTALAGDEKTKQIQIKQGSDGWEYDGQLDGIIVSMPQDQLNDGKKTKIIQISKNDSGWDYKRVDTGLVSFAWILLVIVAILSLAVNSFLIFANRR